MRQVVLLLVLISLPTAPCSAGDEYLLRVETFLLPAAKVKLDKRGAVDVSAPLGDPRHAVELRVERGVPFDVRLKFGTESLDFRGHVGRQEPDSPDHRATVRVDYSYLNDPTHSAVSDRKVFTSVALKLDQRLSLAGSRSQIGNEPATEELICLTARKAPRLDIPHAAELQRRKHVQPLKGPHWVRLTGHGYFDKPVKFQEMSADDRDPLADKLRFSMDVRTTPGKPFQLRTQFGATDTTFAGLLFPSTKPDQVEVELQIDESYASAKYPRTNERDAPIKDKTSASATVSVIPEKETIVGGGITVSSEKLPDGTERALKSSTRFKLSVRKDTEK